MLRITNAIILFKYFCSYLDCGPMTGFDNAMVDAAFFAGTSVRSNILVNLGHGDPAQLFPRSPRLSFDEAARIE